MQNNSKQNVKKIMFIALILLIILLALVIQSIKIDNNKTKEDPVGGFIFERDTIKIDDGFRVINENTTNR